MLLGWPRSVAQPEHYFREVLVRSARRAPIITRTRIMSYIFTMRLAQGAARCCHDVSVCLTNEIGRVSYLIYVSMQYYVLTTSVDIVVRFHTAVCFSC